MTKTLPEKLVIRPNNRVWVSAWAPDQVRHLLSPLPSGATFVDDLSPEVDVAVLFINSRAEFDAIWLAQSEPLAQRPVVWICYPKGNQADVNRDSLWAALTPYGWRPVSQVSADDRWSAVRVRLMNQAELEAAVPAAMIAGDRQAINAVLEASGEAEVAHQTN